MSKSLDCRFYVTSYNEEVTVKKAMFKGRKKLAKKKRIIFAKKR